VREENLPSLCVGLSLLQGEGNRAATTATAATASAATRRGTAASRRSAARSATATTTSRSSGHGHFATADLSGVGSATATTTTATTTATAGARRGSAASRRSAAGSTAAATATTTTATTTRSGEGERAGFILRVLNINGLTLALSQFPGDRASRNRQLERDGRGSTSSLYFAGPFPCQFRLSVTEARHDQQKGQSEDKPVSHVHILQEFLSIDSNQSRDLKKTIPKMVYGTNLLWVTPSKTGKMYEENFR
jgi:hypothetical protein